MAFIERYRHRWGVEPICRVLQFAPSTYYAARNRQPSARDHRDAELKAEIARVHKENFSVYGARKVWLQLGRDNVGVGRDRVARLMKELGLSGVTRGRSVRTTFPASTVDVSDLVDRDFSATAPNRLWVADLTYVRVLTGFCYAAFITDAFSRRIVGWRVAARATAEMVLDALEMALWSRADADADLDGLVHHSDRGVQYLALRYSERLEHAGAVPSVGSKGDSYDNALAEAVHALYKAEVIDRGKPWGDEEDVELATAAWVQWWNERRLHGAIGDVPPAEYEAAFAGSVA